MRKPGAALAVGAGLALAATAAAHAEPVRPGEQSGLGLFGRDVPAVLQEARAQPYAPPDGDDCQAIQAEIAELDAVLGPDADTPAAQEGVGKKAGKLLTGAIRGLIPHRMVVRMVTGAERKDQARAEAAMAGWARRGYLKGMQAQLACPGSTAAPAPPAAVAEAEERRAAAAAPPHAEAAAIPAAAITASADNDLTATLRPPPTVNP